jgi:hypothetical protein
MLIENRTALQSKTIFAWKSAGRLPTSEHSGVG